LDQALHIARRGPGLRVHYAIAVVAAFVAHGGPLDQACWARGVTYYLPDGRASLHPGALGEAAASLLPGADRAAVLWTFDLDAHGVVTANSVERAVVRSRARLTYQEVQAAADAGTGPEAVGLLRRFGEARLRQEAERGGVSLDLPAQEVQVADGGYRLAYEERFDAMQWNAQVSLMAGMAAAERVVAAGIGVLRTMPPPDPAVVDMVRRTAVALGVPWPPGASYASVVGGLDSDDPAQGAVLSVAARGLRGAGYLALPDPDATGRALEHAAVAARYAHVTAPLRRLGDRYVSEVCLAAEANEAPPEWVGARLADLPDALRRADGRASGASRAVVDLVEALVLRPLVGRKLEVTVTAADEDGSTVLCRDPAVQARIRGHRLALGEQVEVLVEAADPVARRVDLEPLG
ncbi:MAG: RNB domain-containing ribonuclease, partial [Acidimicrobiia bacterium]